MQIIEAGWIITPGLKAEQERSLVIDGTHVLDILPWEEARSTYPDAEVIERHHCLLSPGFINTHMHLYGVLAHGLEPPFPLETFESFLEDYWWPMVENRLDPPMIEAATAYIGAELVDSGVTALCDILEAPNAGIEGLRVEAETLKRLGMRAILSSEACERITPERGVEILKENLQFCKEYQDDSHIGGMLCTHTAFTCGSEFMKEAVSMAEDHGFDLQLHLNESSYEPEWVLKHHGMRTCHWYDQNGVLSEHILAAQCVQVDAQEIAILAKHAVRMAHLPLSNCEVGGGIAPVPDLLEAGITCGLGTDGYINNFFAVMRGAFLMHKGHRCDPTVMDGKTVYRMATEAGADVMYPGKEMNRLRKGADADFITISLEDLPTGLTEHNIYDQVILYRDPQHVQDVCIAGSWSKRDYTVQNVDKKQLREQAYEQSRRLWEIVVK